eukprot:246665-Pleurochrysis_carterae.AAC.1
MVKSMSPVSNTPPCDDAGEKRSTSLWHEECQSSWFVVIARRTPATKIVMRKHRQKLPRKYRTEAQFSSPTANANCKHRKYASLLSKCERERDCERPPPRTGVWDSQIGACHRKLSNFQAMAFV